MTSGSLMALSALAASTAASQSPLWGDASSQSSYSILKSPTFQETSSSAMRMPLTIVVVWALLLPVRGRLETILMTSGRPVLDAESQAEIGRSARASTRATARDIKDPSSKWAILGQRRGRHQGYVYPDRNWMPSLGPATLFP